MKNKVSPELEAQAMKIAKSRQKEGQTKEQTKLIAQGIEKGIDEYKKQQNKKLRDLDKQRKQKVRLQQSGAPNLKKESPLNSKGLGALPWVLLAVSWLGFVSYIGFQQLTRVS